MNRQYLLDSLDGFKGLIFRLLPARLAGSLACVPMTTDGPWHDAEKRAFEAAVGIPSERTYWTPGGFDNVPAASDTRAREEWVHAVGAIKEPHVFLDPDTGFYDRHTGGSTKTVLVGELATILATREVVIVYRHQYWPKVIDAPRAVCPYVWHGLGMLRKAGLYSFAYQSQAASFFFVSRDRLGVDQFETALRQSMAGLTSAIVNRRLVLYSSAHLNQWVERSDLRRASQP
jgi:hypothetical protein